MARASNNFNRPHSKSFASEGKPPEREKGRGACSNMSGRYEAEQREAFDDGWGFQDHGKPSRTSINVEKPRKIITTNKSPYVGFDRSINPYRGCEHGCIYCFARPTHAYMGLSAGLDFERELFIKPSAPKLLERELSKPSYRPKTIAIGTNTDPYQPIERKFQIMRQLLNVFGKFNHPVSILTKSKTIVRDLDILAPLAEKNLTRAMLSITTEDRKLARSMEPRASTPAKRFEALAELSAAGIQTGVMIGPVIPGLTDFELESIMTHAKEAGASYCGYTILRLPLEVSQLFQEWLEATVPNKANRIMSHIRDLNGGRDYDPEWSRGNEIKKPYAKLIGQRFYASRRRLAFSEEIQPLNHTAFRVPVDISGQFGLFDSLKT